MFFNKAEIVELLKLLDKTYTSSQEEKFKFGKYLNFFKRIFRFYSVNMITVTSLLFLTPAITFITSRKKTYPIISPFSNDKDVGGMYPVALFYSFWTFLTLIFSLYPAELIFAGVLVTLSVEFEILKELLEDLPSKSDSEQIQLMKLFVDRHNELSDRVATVEKIYSFPLFIFFVSSSFFISLRSYRHGFYRQHWHVLLLHHKSTSSLHSLLLRANAKEFVRTSDSRALQLQLGGCQK